MEPTRKLFYIIALILFGFTGKTILDDGFSSVFSIGVLITSGIYFVFGMFIIYYPKQRDRLFGMRSCPSCCSSSISIKGLFKSAPTELYSFLFCSNCGDKILLHPSWYIFASLVLFAPLGIIILGGSVLQMFLVGWFTMVLLVWFMAKLLPLISIKI